MQEHDGKYGVILGDPAWKYRNFADKAHGAAIAHYGTMDFADIAAIPVPRWAAPDCVLALWGCWPKLDEAVDLVRAWGFSHVTGFPWIKTVPSAGTIYCGVGFWVQGASEFMVIARRGNPKSKLKKGEKGASVRGLIHGDPPVFYLPPAGEDATPTDEGPDPLDPEDVAAYFAPRNERHSAKPLELHAWLMRRLSGPYLELFARNPRDDWTTWGYDTGFALTRQGVEPVQRVSRLVAASADDF